MTSPDFLLLSTAFAVALPISVALILLLMPLWRRRALALPNARSSHTAPTPQGGGLAVMLAVLAVLWVAPILAPDFALPLSARITLSAAIIALVVVGAWDDMRPLPALPRLTIQALAVMLMLFSIKGILGIFPFLPTALALILLFVGALWFVNLVNFMDGLDWLTVAGLAPACAAVTALSVFGHVAAPIGWIAAGLFGALIGFAIFNKPVARLFLGDVGSLPIGLTVAWLLYSLAANGHLAAALLLPLYHCADATITLFRRMARREYLMAAHRSHFYQRATTNGFSVISVSAHIAFANILLALLAGLTVIASSMAVKILGLLAGVVIVGTVLWRFQRSRGTIP